MVQPILVRGLSLVGDSEYLSLTLASINHLGTLWYIYRALHLADLFRPALASHFSPLHPQHILALIVAHLRSVRGPIHFSLLDFTTWSLATTA